MMEVEQHISWTDEVNRIKHDVDDIVCGPEEEVGRSEEQEDIPMIVVESNQQSEHTDAPIVIYPNDPSVVGAEEIVMEEDEPPEIQWTMHPVAKEEVIVPSTERKRKRAEDFGDIPLNDESYATFHPFPCDFCSRRFKKKANLINHMVAHQTQRPFGCDICSSKFMRRCDLVNHQKIHAYLPNRDNLQELDSDNSFKYNSQRKKRRRASKPRLSSSSPEGNQHFKPTSYVDEDVKLLLEMTSKLHDSRQAERSGGPSNEADRQISGTEGKPYICKKCNKCFARESALVSHSQVHAEDSWYDCSKCGTRFFTQELLSEHYSKKHGITYTGESSDSSEEKSPPGRKKYTGDERFGTFYCTICAISFKKIELLRQHQKAHIRKDEYSGLYRCLICHSMFMTNDKLLEHIDLSVNCQQNVCMLCAEHFNDQESVAKHIQVRHSRDLTEFGCSYCGKPCKDQKTLKRHIWVHISEKGNDGLTSRGKTVSCHECDKTFPDRGALMVHRQTHYTRNVGGQKRFVCHECGKSFGSRSSQQIHNRIHTGERPYGCRYCWKAFADGGTLRKHERIHTGEKPYACAVCPRAFNQRVVLREHIRSHHSGTSNKMGYSSPVYLCPVCGVITSGSDELALHIVKHSDDNTVKNRTPQASRPFKRRNRASSMKDFYEFDEADYFDNRSTDTESVETEIDKKISPVTSPTKKSAKNRRSNSYTALTDELDAAMKNMASLVEPQPVRKAKMINSKLQSNAGRAKKGIKKRGRRGAETGRAVVTIIKPRVRTMSGRLSGRKDSGSEVNDDSTIVKGNIEESAEEVESSLDATKRLNRPRTKNVNYQTLQAMSKGLTRATFPENPNDSGLKVKTEPTVDPVDSSSKQEKIEEDGNGDSYVCGICNAVFISKADLLFHVPVHI